MPKFVIRKSRYIDGKYIFAAPDQPAVIELGEHVPTDKDEGLEPYDGDPKPIVLGRHFNDVAKEHPQSVLKVQSTPLPDKAKDKNWKRPSNAEPL